MTQYVQIDCVGSQRIISSISLFYFKAPHANRNDASQKKKNIRGEMILKWRLCHILSSLLAVRVCECVRMYQEIVFPGICERPKQNHNRFTNLINQVSADAWNQDWVECMAQTLERANRLCNAKHIRCWLRVQRFMHGTAQRKAVWHADSMSNLAEDIYLNIQKYHKIHHENWEMWISHTHGASSDSSNVVADGSKIYGGPITICGEFHTENSFDILHACGHFHSLQFAFSARTSKTILFLIVYLFS